jgi:hypothetical protein
MKKSKDITTDTIAMKIQKLLIETLNIEKSLSYISRIKFDMQDGKVNPKKRTIKIRDGNDTSFSITIQED